MCCIRLDELRNVSTPDLCQMQSVLFGLLLSIQILPIIILKSLSRTKFVRYNNITNTHQAIQFSKISASFSISWLNRHHTVPKILMLTFKVNTDMVHVVENYMYQNIKSSLNQVKGIKLLLFVIFLMCLHFVKQDNDFCQQRELHEEKNPITS